MKNNLKDLFNLLGEEDKKKSLKLLILLAVLGFVEMLGIASILPFLAVVSNPDVIFESIPLKNSYVFFDKYFGNIDVTLFLIILGVFSFLFILITSFFRIYSLFLMNKYIETTRHNLSSRLLVNYLNQPYDFFLDRHTSELTKNMMSEVDFIIISVFRPIILMISYLFVLVSIVGLIMWYEPMIAITAIVSLGLLYMGVYLFSRSKILRYGDLLVKSNKKRFKSASDALSGIKNIKMYNCENIYVEKFKIFSLDYIRSAYRFQILNQAPKHLLEALAFGGIILLTIFILLTLPEGVAGLGNVIPILGLYAFSAYRIQPALTAIFQGASSLSYGKAAIHNLTKEFNITKNKNSLINIKNNRLIPEKTISLNNISHKFKNSENIINEVNLTITVGSNLGILGGSGAGKTTLLDIILGLHSPTIGYLSVDNLKIDETNIINWKMCLGYVPQTIYLIDNSFAENIAFGVPVNEIDFKKVIECAKIAQIHDFIVDENSEGYLQKVGERGARISGGQSQRIGIARALYTNPDVLILDEATNALDTITEKKVLDSIQSAMQLKTIIIVTHKLSTVKNCNSIILLEKGNIKAVGSYDDLKNLDLNYFEIKKNNN